MYTLTRYSSATHPVRRVITAQGGRKIEPSMITTSLSDYNQGVRNLIRSFFGQSGFICKELSQSILID